MSPLDRDVLAERTMAVERHLRRVADRLPPSSVDLQPATDASDVYARIDAVAADELDNRSHEPPAFRASTSSDVVVPFRPGTPRMCVNPSDAPRMLGVSP